MSMKLKLKNKNIIIVGASGLIGECISKKILENGANVILFDVNKDKCINLSKALKKKYNKETNYFIGDVSKKNNVKKLLEFSIKINFKINGLVNCQQYTSKKFFEDLLFFNKKEL